MNTTTEQQERCVTCGEFTPNESTCDFCTEYLRQHAPEPEAAYRFARSLGGGGSARFAKAR